MHLVEKGHRSLSEFPTALDLCPKLSSDRFGALKYLAGG
jgi:hypothetical protein